jgi:hypothetical protein
MKGFHVKTLAPRGNNDEDLANAAGGESVVVEAENPGAGGEASGGGADQAESMPT